MSVAYLAKPSMIHFMDGIFSSIDQVSQACEGLLSSQRRYFLLGHLLPLFSGF